MRPEVFDALPVEEKDRVIVERLRKFGDELGKPRRVTHVVQIDARWLDAKQEPSLERSMRNFGFEFQHVQRTTLNNGVKVDVFYFQKHQSVTLDEVQRVTKQIRLIVGWRRGMYLGWQTQPVRILDDRGNG